MKTLIYLASFLVLLSCNNGQKTTSNQNGPHPVKNSKPSKSTQKDIQYSGQQLEAYLDSIGHLATQPLADKIAFGADSVFRNQPQLDLVITAQDLKTLRHTLKKGFINVDQAKAIFKDPQIDTSCRTASVMLTYKKGNTPILYFPFGKNKKGVDEFAICIGDPGHCEHAYLYFFEGNKVISKHNGYNRYGLELKHYKDTDGKTVVYYVKGFVSGSGIWWNNFFFYKYDDGKLIPVLNELENGNMQGYWGFRVLWLESTIQKTKPLTIKMAYYNQFADISQIDYSPKITDDSTMVQYNWNEKSRMLEGQYDQSKISKAQVLSYYVANNDLLYINAYYKTLKASLADKTKRKWALTYLNKVKNDETRDASN
ncbi:hypothetical protein [Pedobacter sp. ASV12]|uniref:hypothetical protein n=1 Tax=Pedobacter sp. ASV12 TaxID=2795120 RepID=UPI0018ED8AD3|nr:hypothetical protein [Pedobacter sp. ASV12]